MSQPETEPKVLSCGCRLTWRGAFAHLYPCSEIHRTTAALARKPGSQIIIHAPKRG